MELVELEDESLAIKALGSLFKLTEIYLWDDASVETREGSGFSNQLKSAQDVNIGSNYASMTSDDFELELQMDALGLPLSFRTNKERNVMVRGKGKDTNKKHLHTNAKIKNAVPPNSIKVNGQEITSPTIINDNMSNSLCCMSMPCRSESSYCDVAVDVNDIQFFSGEGEEPATLTGRITSAAVKEHSYTDRISEVSFKYRQDCESVNSQILSKEEASPINVDDGTSSGSCLINEGDGHVEKKHGGGLTEHSFLEGPSVDDHYTEGEKLCSVFSTKMSQGPDSAACSQFSEVLGHDNIDSECNDNFGGWRTYWDSFYSRNYFYNTRKLVSTWDAPPGMEHLASVDEPNESKEMVVDVAEMEVGPVKSFHYSKKLDSFDSHYSLDLIEESRKGDGSLELPPNETLLGFGLGADNFHNSSSEHLNEPHEINKNSDETSVYSLSDTQQQMAILACALPKSLSEEVMNTEPCLRHINSIEDKLNAERETVTTKRKKKVRKKRLHRKISVDSEELKYQGISEEFSPIIKKYWWQRYLLFSKFDNGIRMDEEGWFSVTPELIAKHHASRCGSGIIVDCFTGVGGNAIQFAQRCKQVVAIDIDPKKIDYAQHNAAIYGVEDHIEFIRGDYFLLAPKLKADTVFLSPPWGGPSYAKVKIFDIKTMLKPHDGNFLFTVGKRIASRIVMFLPRNVNLNQLAELCLSANPPWSLEVEKNFLNGKLKAITAYFSDPSVYTMTSSL